MLPGWENSKGARLEVHIARELGMKFCECPLSGVDGECIMSNIQQSKDDLDGRAVLAQQTCDRDQRA